MRTRVMLAATTLIVIALARPAWSLVDGPEVADQWHHAAVADAAAQATSTGAGVVVAVVDSGVDPTQEDLQGVVLPGHTFATDGEHDGAVDQLGHGTAVASVIAAVAGNGIGGRGVAPGVRILPVKDYDPYGNTPALMPQAIRWAVDHGAQVINVSQSANRSADLDAAIGYAADHDVLVVAAAGNEGRYSQVYYPAGDPRVLAVGALDRDGAVAPFSSWGPDLDVVAPGVAIVGPSRAGGYATEDGTSFAAPVVAGIAALIRSTAPSLSAQAVADAIRSSAIDLGPPGRDDAYGFGLVDAVAALRAAGVHIAPDPAPLPDPVRYAGSDRFETAAAASAATFPSGAATVVVATGADFPDALAAGPLAAAVGPSPVLLVSRSSVPAATAAELARLAPTSVVVLGGRSTIDDGVVAQLAVLTGARVTRVAGPDRFATAAAAAARAFPGGATEVYLASGTGFADALAAGTAGALRGAPVLLTTASGLPAATAAEIVRLHPQVVKVYGGAAAVPDALVASLRTLTNAKVERVFGRDRFATAVAAAADAFPSGAPAVVVASGTGFADALAAASVARAVQGPLLLTPGACLTDHVRGQLAALAPARTVVVGGPSAVADSALAGAAC